MASEKNKIQELVPDDEDPTAELEAITFRDDERFPVSRDHESDASTFGLHERDADPEQENESIAELRSDLQSRAKTIGRLQHDIEKLRSKWLGLETEIKAREAIVTNLTQDIAHLRETVGHQAESLKARDASVRALKAEVRERDLAHRKLIEEHAELQQALERSDDIARERDTALKKAQDKIETLQEKVGSARAEIAVNYGKDQALRELRTQMSRTERYADDLRFKLKDFAETHDGLNRDRAKLTRELAELEDSKDQLTSDLAASKTNAKCMQEEIDQLRTAHAEDLRILRFELDEAQNTVVETSDLNSQLTADLQESRGHNDDLERMLRENEEQSRQQVEKLERNIEALKQSAKENEQKLEERLQTKIEDLQKVHEEELRLLRFELGEAQNTVTETSDLNSQLTADLHDSRGYKDELERILLENEERSQQQIQELEQDIETLKQSAEENEQKLEKRTQKEIGELQKAHEEELRLVRCELDEVQKTAAESSDLNTRLAADLQEFRGDKDELERMLFENEEHSQQQIQKLEQDIETLKQSAKDDEQELEERAQKEIEKLRTVYEEEKNLLQSELDEAKNVVADTSDLNSRLTADLQESRGSRDEFERMLRDNEEQAGKQIEGLEQDIEALKRSAKDSAQEHEDRLQNEIENLRKAHEEEIRILRFELDEAQNTVAETSDLNSQLKTDLQDTRGYKDELERMLSENEEQSQKQIEKLEKNLEKLTQSAEEYEQKLESKSSAINVLLGELAKKSEQLEAIGDIEEVIQDIDDRMSERLDDIDGEERVETGKPQVSKEREKMSRVLIGRIGDQVLRFPLFKDRLTIGRTDDNDIQLKPAYISRRHAVVITEGDRTRVVDWGSKNGVYVNSKRVKEHFLSNGDIVAVGNAKFRYEERKKREIG